MPDSIDYDIFVTEDNQMKRMEGRIDELVPTDNTVDLSDEDFARKWHGPARVLCIVHFGHLRDFGNPARGLSLPHVLAKSPNGKFYLVANRP